MESYETNSREQIAELQALTAPFAVSLRRRVAMWAIRWAIGFGLIALAVQQWPSATWLWWAGAAVAGLSLVSMLAMHVILLRRTAGLQEKLEGLDRMVEEAENETRQEQ
ncbi:hypothetical protein [Microbulbifer yueqingensis]|uniref:Holin-X, holin superfamily III n=1 Tax=Microbulbifer yueqingensis TaxID=658219 RepID=A0A1G9DIH0_9GAMM|nr:hypothetical protein [Microbulbifer yueqingensis]SDK63648.1 hypothetical protein SAMN05216212_2820 [Microbulbifer yueqingensis]